MSIKELKAKLRSAVSARRYWVKELQREQDLSNEHSENAESAEDEANRWLLEIHKLRGKLKKSA